MFSDHVGAFFDLFWRVRGVGGKLAFAKTILWGRYGPGAKSDRKIVDVRFKQFVLSFRVGQGELEPYLSLQGEVRQILAHIPEPVSELTVMDIGANIGVFSLLLKEARRIVAVEPNPGCCERIRQNFRANNVRGTVVPKAIHSETGKLRLQVADGNTVLSRVAADGNVEADATTVDALIEEFGLDRVDLLKLDVEGHELNALRGGRRALTDKRVRFLYVETASPEAMRANDDFLLPLGYKQVWVAPYNILYQVT